MKVGEHDRYLRGEALYGDDLRPDEIETWFRDEAEGYANLGAGNADSYRYAYHALNQRMGFSHLPRERFSHAMGVGSAYGSEFAPIAERIDELTILEPSEAFSGVEEVEGVPCTYVKPSITGEIPFPDSTFDLIVCLGALHHIPNVSFVLEECSRCLDDGGVMVLREPIVSMGDWRNPRPGLTRNERGIPIGIFEQIIEDSEFDVLRSRYCVFPPIARLATRLGVSAYNSAFLTALDDAACQLFKWNLRYHATSKLQRFRPTAAYFVLERRKR